MTVFSFSHACVSAWRYPFVECGPVCHHLFSANLFLTENSIFGFWFTALRDTSVHLHNSRNSAEAARAATVKGTLRRGRLAGTERVCLFYAPSRCSVGVSAFFSVLRRSNTSEKWRAFSWMSHRVLPVGRTSRVLWSRSMRTGTCALQLTFWGVCPGRLLCEHEPNVFLRPSNQRGSFGDHFILYKKQFLVFGPPPSLT